MKLRTIIFCITLPLLLSCTAYLDIKPYGQTIPQTPEEFSALMQDHLFDIEYGEGVIIGDISSVCDLECYADNFEANLQAYPQGNYIPLYIGDRINNQMRRYENLYAVIRDCNIVIDGIGDSSTQVARNTLGTAYAIRGICYYNLLRDFCEPCVGNPDGLGVPLVTEFDIEERPVRSTVEQTFRRAEADMLQAIACNIDDDLYIFNSDIMNGYLARLHFWVGSWTEAASYASKVLQAHPLLNGEAYLAMMASEVTPSGNILVKGYSRTDSDNRVAYSGSKSYMASRPVSRSFVQLFSADGDNDIRYSISFSGRRVFTKSVFSCLRSAEMQLILAESRYHSSDQAGALAALNELRRNRISGVADYTMDTLPPVDQDGLVRTDALGNSLTPLLYAILCERRKELFMEGDRWYELKRNGCPEFWVAKQGRKYTTQKFMYTFPLPISDIELVDGLIRNPGYVNAI